jgi:hypothetical protein
VAPGGECEPGAEGLVDLAPGVAQAGRLQPVALHPRQPDPLGEPVAVGDELDQASSRASSPRSLAGRTKGTVCQVTVGGQVVT